MKPFHCMQINRIMFEGNAWKHLIACRLRIMLSINYSFKNMYLMYIHQQDLALNYQPGFICRKTQPTHKHIHRSWNSRTTFKQRQQSGHQDILLSFKRIQTKTLEYIYISFQYRQQSGHRDTLISFKHRQQSRH